MRTEEGCGTATFFDVDIRDGMLALVEKRPPSETWDLGARLEVDGEVVREIRPAPFWGLRVSWAEDPPEATVLVRLEAAEGGCWSATIKASTERGCGSTTFPLVVRGDTNIIFERRAPETWKFGVALEPGGRVVQTVGPSTDEDAVLAFGYAVPRESE